MPSAEAVSVALRDCPELPMVLPSDMEMGSMPEISDGDDDEEFDLGSQAKDSPPSSSPSSCSSTADMLIKGDEMKGIVATAAVADAWLSWIWKLEQFGLGRVARHIYADTDVDELNKSEVQVLYFFVIWASGMRLSWLYLLRWIVLFIFCGCRV